MNYRVRLLDTSFAANVVGLLVVDKDRRTYLGRDGTWRSIQEGPFQEGVRIESEMLTELPRDAVEALAEAVDAYLGHASHGATEARVLREWLAVEQRRVDAALAGDR